MFAGVQEGLQRKNHKHIVFATAYDNVGTGVSDNGRVKVEDRPAPDIFIEIDLRAAIADGIAFYVASNGALLTEGLNGVLPAGYFSRVVDRSGKQVPID